MRMGAEVATSTGVEMLLLVIEFSQPVGIHQANAALAQRGKWEACVSDDFLNFCIVALFLIPACENMY